MTTIKAIKAALAQKFTVSSIRENMKTAMSSPWDEELAWCLEQIEARDALLRRFVDHYAGGHDDYCSGCHRNCAEARKIPEESK